MSVKISIIGAGSAIFSLNIIKDLCLTKRLAGSTVSLMDLNPDRLEAVYNICVRYARELGENLNVERTTDRLECLAGADYVINTACGLGHAKWKEIWDKAYEKGYRMGGSLAIISDEAFYINFYQYRIMEEVYLDMQKVCPNAWYLLVANPVIGGVTFLKRKYPDMKLLGLCHGTHRAVDIMNCMGLDMNQVEYEVPGVNHFVWLSKFKYKGENAFPLLEKWMDENMEKYRDYDIGPKAYDLYKRFGAWPIGDTATPGGNSWPYWYHTDDSLNQKWDEDPRSWFDKVYFGPTKAVVDQLMTVAKDESLKVTSVYPPEKSGEPIIPIIESLAFNIPRVIIINVMNTDEYLEGIPKDFQVEVPCLINGKGCFPMHQESLNKPILAYALRDKVAPYEMELAAFNEGSYDLLLSLILMDPYTRSEKQAIELLDAILNTPGLEEMKAHYRKGRRWETGGED